MKNNLGTFLKYLLNGEILLCIGGSGKPLIAAVELFIICYDNE